MTSAGKARRLRRDTTEAERRLWAYLRGSQLGVKFRRQMPIDRYVVDFASERAKIVIEVDGSQHARAIQHDAARTASLASRGFPVLRFWNNEALENLEEVMGSIERTLAERGVSP